MDTNKQPSDPPIIPRIDILPWDEIPGIGMVKKLGGALIRVIYFFPLNAPDCMSEHFKHPLDDTFDRPEYQGTLWDNQEIAK